MRPLFACTLLTSTLLLATVAHADEYEPKERGFELAARAGVGAPLGEIAERSKMTEFVGAKVPLWLDVGYRVNPMLFVGAYFIYAPTFVKSTANRECAANGASCSARDVRIGIQVQLHLAPARRFDPWVGFGIGYETMTLGTRVEGREQTLSASGFEYLHFQAGGDYRIDPTIGLGPFVSFSVARFSTASESRTGFGVNDRSSSETIDKQSIHGWLVVGLRGVFTL